MTGSVRAFGAISAAVLFGWCIRGFHGDETRHETRAAAQPAVVVTEPQVNAAEPRFAQVTSLHRVESTSGRRNLFAFHERRATAATSPVAYVVAPPAAAVEPPAQTIAQETVPPEPTFAYRLFGTFGTKDVRLAAFHDGDAVITARAGDRIGSEFILESVGSEGVSVRPVTRPAAATHRIPLNR